MNTIVYSGFHTVNRIETNIKGRERIIEKLDIKSAVGAFVVDSDGKIGLVKQYRPCVDEYLYEIPAGLMDKHGKTQEQIIIEELFEECDIKQDEISYISPIAEYYMVCGSSDAKMQLYHVFLNTVKQSKKVDDNDVEEVLWISLEEFKELYISGQIKDSKTQMAYFYYDAI